MGFLAKIFSVVPKEEREGLSLGKDAHWEVSSSSDLPSFLRSLHHIVPSHAILYLEGGGPPPKDIVKFFSEQCVPEVRHIAMGTIWPRPQVFHLPATRENLIQLAVLAEQCNRAQIAIHLHVYAGDVMLLEWHDAFFQNPMHLSKDVTEDSLKAICSELSLQYNRFGEHIEHRGAVDAAARRD